MSERGAALTYNFDPDRWFDMEETALKARLAKGDLDQQEFDLAMAALADKYEEMLERVDIRHDY